MQGGVGIETSRVHSANEISATSHTENIGQFNMAVKKLNGLGWLMTQALKTDGLPSSDGFVN